MASTNGRSARNAHFDSRRVAMAAAAGACTKLMQYAGALGAKHAANGAKFSRCSPKILFWLTLATR